MILGITGCPGSGKSTLARTVAAEGWELVDADKMGREIVEKHEGLLDELAFEFGSDIIDADGFLNRRLLAERAFENTERVRRLNGIVHPALVKELLETISRYREQQVKAVVDCALIFEWNIESEFDYVVTVIADESVRMGRIGSRDGRPESVIRGITRAQLPETEKMLRADITVKNNREIERLETFGRILAGLSRT